MQNISIWVDADSCHSKAKDVILNTAIKYSIPVNYVANRNIPFSMENILFKMIICQSEKDAADTYILEHCNENDIIITRDLPLAKKLIEKNKTVINDRGIIFTQRILEKMLRERELSMQMAALGIRNGKFNTYSKEDLQNFSETITQIITN